MTESTNLVRYLALLRGINVGGNNKVAMSELRACFETLGFEQVSTYINSGNILFESDERDEAKLVKQCEAAIEKTFGFTVVVMIISRDSFESALADAPTWWGRGEDRTIVRSDALFVIPPTTTAEVMAAIKTKSGSPDQFAEYGQIIFWSLPMASYSKSVVPKIIGTPIYRHVTVRSSTTTRRLLELFARTD